MPLTNEAEVALLNEDVDEQTSVDFLKIPSDLFDKLWMEGVWRTISDRCGIILDDYETSFVQAEKLTGVEDALLARIDVSPEFVESLLRLVKSAILRRRFLVFVL